MDNGWQWSSTEADILAEEPRLDSPSSSDSKSLCGSDDCLQEDDRMSASSDELGGDKTIKQILHQWGVQTNANKNLPVLVLPEPIAFLILHGKWKTILLQCCWHSRLVDGYGMRFHKRNLFAGVDTACCRSAKRTSNHISKKPRQVIARLDHLQKVGIVAGKAILVLIMWSPQ